MEITVQMWVVHVSKCVCVLVLVFPRIKFHSCTETKEGVEMHEFFFYMLCVCVCVLSKG